MTPVRLRSALLGPLALLVLAPGAAAGERLDATVQSAAAAQRACQAELAPGGAGVETRTVVSDANGLVRARLTAAGGDWDLGVFDKATGRSVAGSAYFGSNELAEGIVRDGQELVVQACRLSGDSEAAQLKVDVVGLPAPTPNRIRLASVELPNQGAKMALDTLDLDLTEHARPGHRDVVLYDAAEEAKLTRAGLKFEITIADLVAADRRDAATVRSARAGTSVPSGRTSYRRLPDYGADMKKLVTENPDLVKPITLKNPSLEGRPVEGIEITKDVNAADGKPVFVQTGVHHAREWPSAEHAMEFAFELVNGVKAKDKRISEALDKSRVIVVPIVNPDGFNLSRESMVDSGQPVVDPGFAYKRRNCRIKDNELPAMGVCGMQANRNRGTDPNRNYGGLWGGAGASNSPTSDIYRGAGPFSEPETQNVRDLVSTRQVVTFITNHTYSDLVLRPPGVAALGDPPDENRGYKQLGDDMAAENGYKSEKSFELYDTTGTTEDWTYPATGGFGFTFEIGPAADGPTGLETLVGSGFHPPYPAGVIQEYNGKYPTGGGNREAYLVALESTINPERHSRVAGKAPAGATIRLKKSFDTTTSPVVQSGRPADPPIKFRDTLETAMTVPASGDFEYHTNPSTRPAAVGKAGRNAEGPTTLGMKFGSQGGTISFPSQDPAASTPQNRRDFPFTIKPEDDNVSVNARIQWASVEDDWDLFLYRQGGATPLASSANGGTDSEELTYSLGKNQKLPAGQYFVRVIDFDTTDKKFDGETAFDGPTPSQPTTIESWTMTCEVGGTVLATREVVVDRGERRDLGEACGRGTTPGATNNGGGATNPGGTKPGGGVAGTTNGGKGTANDGTGAKGGAARGLVFSVAIDRRRLGKALSRGLRVRARCSVTCRVGADLVVPGTTARKLGLTKGTRAVRVGRGTIAGLKGRRTVIVRFTKAAKRKLRGARSVTLNLRATAKPATGTSRKRTLKVRLRR